jgi:uncharacterized damage-inducible protein DinB
MEEQRETMLLELIRYNNWANGQVIAACQKLEAAQLATALPGAYGSVHRTLGHIIHSEADYVGRMTGKRPLPPFAWEAGPSVDELAAFAAEVGAALLEAARQGRPADIVREEEDGQWVQYQKGGLLIQVINHGIEHRTNITTFLNLAGLGPPEVDGWGYMWAHKERFEVAEGTSQQG